LYLLFSFWFLRTIKKSDESMLWAGLAKETAHQIGTPLSSMIGWVEVMKLDANRNDDVVHKLILFYVHYDNVLSRHLPFQNLVCQAFPLLYESY
jgi:hypothetical protein